MNTKNMIKIILPVSVILISSIYFSCQSPTGPDDITPGRRDYVWTVDTLNYPYDTMYRMWGSSPTDVWTTSSGDHDKSISHFNGVNWTSYGVARMNVPHSIYGFASDNVYVGSGGGGIWNFNGSNWTNVANLTKDGHSDIVFDNMWGASSMDVYATGAYGDTNGLANKSVIAHLANGKWEIINTDGLNGIVEHLYKNSMDGNIYLQVIKFSNTYDSTFIYEYNQGNYTKLYSTIWDKYWATISLINNKVYFVLRSEIASRVDNRFQTVLKLDNTNFYKRIWGRNTMDIFLLMTDGLAHYNGSNIEYLFHFNKPRTQIFGSALFNNEVFFLVYESQTNLNLIYHGKLK